MQAERNKAMKKRIGNKIFFSVLIIAICILIGCREKESLSLTQLQTTNQEILSKENVATAEVENLQEETMAEEVQLQEKVEQTEETPAKAVLFVHICGAVNSPGVYEFSEGDRIYQAVETAGGFTKEAASDFLNQAQKLTDGMKLYIPTKEEAEQALAAGKSEEPFVSYEGGLTGSQGAAEDLININTASEELLCTLPGIGSGKAKSIVTYRTEQGSFAKIEDIMKVEGIKEGLFEKIRDRITV